MQGLAKQSRLIMEKLRQGNWKDVSTVGKMQSILRLSDQQIFTIGDFVTNGTKMRGKIESFETDEKVKNRKPGSPIEIFVITDWSGIGMDLDSIYHAESIRNRKQPKTKEKELVFAGPTLAPHMLILENFSSIFRPDDFCGVKLGKKEVIGAQVTKVAFTKTKVLYDVEIGTGDGQVTRLHSVDSSLIVSLAKKAG